MGFVAGITIILMGSLSWMITKGGDVEEKSNLNSPPEKTQGNTLLGTNDLTLIWPEALDLSKLQGKDRLYTEEEGKYENLSEEERRLVAKAYCIDKEGEKTWICENLDEIEYLENVRDVRLVSLKNEIAVLYGPSGAEMQGWIFIYDVTNNARTYHVDHGNYAFSNNYAIRSNHSSSAEYLEYYQPGMRNFIEIPKSRLDPSLTYLKWKGMIRRELRVRFLEDRITVNVYKHECDMNVISEFGGLPVECINIFQETKIFDLSNLQ